LGTGIELSWIFGIPVIVSLNVRRLKTGSEKLFFNRYKQWWKFRVAGESNRCFGIHPEKSAVIIQSARR
jgi:hypothetical protein